MKKMFCLIMVMCLGLAPAYAKTCGKSSFVATVLTYGANTLLEGNGSDAVYDPVRQKTYGCGCSGTNGGDVGNKGAIFCENGGTRKCATVSKIGGILSAGIARNRFKSCSQTMCNGYSAYNSDRHELVPDLEKMCWKYKCRSGYFEGGGFVDGVEIEPSINKCVQCSGMTDTVQGDSCYHIKCEGVAAGTHVIYNKKCMPVCDMQTTGAVYDDSDSTYISIKINRKNAGILGEVTE